MENYTGRHIVEVHVEDLRGQDRCRYKLKTGKIISLHHQVELR